MATQRQDNHRSVRFDRAVRNVYPRLQKSTFYQCVQNQRQWNDRTTNAAGIHILWDYPLTEANSRQREIRSPRKRRRAKGGGSVDDVTSPRKPTVQDQRSADNVDSARSPATQDQRSADNVDSARSPATQDQRSADEVDYPEQEGRWKDMMDFYYTAEWRLQIHCDQFYTHSKSSNPRLVLVDQKDELQKAIKNVEDAMGKMAEFHARMSAREREEVVEMYSFCHTLLVSFSQELATELQQCELNIAQLDAESNNG